MKIGCPLCGLPMRDYAPLHVCDEYCNCGDYCRCAGEPKKINSPTKLSIKDMRGKARELEIHALAYCNRPDIIEDGIHSLLQQQKKEIIEKIEKLREERPVDEYWDGYNKAIDQIKSIIEK